MKKAIEKAGGNIKDVVRTCIYRTNAKEWEQAAKPTGIFFQKLSLPLRLWK